MNKSEFISAVAEKSGLSKVDAKKAVEAFVDTVSNELKEGGKVALLGFGSFSVSEKAARKGVNPKTKETIEIAARKAVKFKAGERANQIRNTIILYRRRIRCKLYPFFVYLRVQIKSEL